jgi:tRNA(adenine34) deaminase
VNPVFEVVVYQEFLSRRPTEEGGMLVVDESRLMREALEMAQQALSAGDHPYGAVVVTDSGTIAERNRVVTTNDPTAHSEVMAIRTAASRWGYQSVRDSILVTSFEPCPMCLGAIMEAGVSSLVIGARRTVGEAPLGDYTVEALLSLMGRTDDIKITHGPLATEMADFYATQS